MFIRHEEEGRMSRWPLGEIVMVGLMASIFQFAMRYIFTTVWPVPALAAFFQ